MPPRKSSARRQRERMRPFRHVPVARKLPRESVAQRLAKLGNGIRKSSSAEFFSEDRPSCAGASFCGLLLRGAHNRVMLSPETPPVLEHFFGASRPCSISLLSVELSETRDRAPASSTERFTNLKPRLRSHDLRVRVGVRDDRPPGASPTVPRRASSRTPFSPIPVMKLDSGSRHWPAFEKVDFLRGTFGENQHRKTELRSQVRAQERARMIA